MRPFNTTVLLTVNTPVLGKANTMVFNCPIMKLSERLRIAREHAGLTQEELGNRAGCGQGLVSKIERGDQESTSYVVKLAKACGVRAEWLDDEDGPMLDENILKVAQHTVEYQVQQTMKQMDQRTKLQLLKIGNSLIEPEEGNGHTPTQAAR